MQPEDWQIESSPAIVEKLQALVERVRQSERAGLRGQILKLMEETPGCAAVAVSPPEFGDGRDGVVSVAYTLKPLMAGMEPPPGWAVYGRPRPDISPVIFESLS